MITTETHNPSIALRALRLINKARQCAKRGDVHGMYSYTDQACLDCTRAPPWVAKKRVDNFVAYKVTYQIRKLCIIADKGKCSTFVRHTSYLGHDVHELVEAMQEERKHGI